MKYSKEVKTALLAIVAIILLIFGYNFLKGKNLLDSSRIFHAVYDDVEGLSLSSTVTVNGLKVGQVTEINFLNQTGQLVVTFTVERDFEFSRNSVAEIYGGNILGGKSIAIIPEYEQGQMAESGDTLTSNVEEGLMELVNEKLAPLQQKVESTIVSADSLVSAINSVLDDTTRYNIKNTFRELHFTVAAYKNTAQALNEVIDGNSEKINRTFTNLDEMSGNFNSFSDSLSQVDLKGMSNDLERVVADFEQISRKLNNGEGTAGKLLQDDQVYDNLNRATKQLEQLVQDVKLNPRRYVRFSLFGKEPRPYQPPEDSLK